MIIRVNGFELVGALSVVENSLGFQQLPELTGLML
jgi:hypothetical protein